MRRSLFALLALALAIVASALAPPAQALPAREIAGVALHPWNMKDAGEAERTFADIAALGVRWARVDLRWSRVEPWGPAVTDGRGDWTEMDRIVAAADRHGIRLLPMVAFSPPWASPSAQLWALPRAAAFEDFFAAALRRYPQIPAWELWNEPNYGAFAKPAPDPAGYVAFLRTAYGVRARVGSRAKLISGGLAPGAEVDIVDWVDQMARLGGLSLIDGLGVHPYSPVDAGNPRAWMMRLEALHGRLAFFGRPDLELWLTEYGAPVSSPATGFGPAGLSEEQQAQWLRLAFALATQLPFVENLTWFEYRDSCTTPGDPECRFGLRRHDLSERPAYHALREVVAETTRLQGGLALSATSRGAPAHIAEAARVRGSKAARARASSRRRAPYVYLKGVLLLPASPSADRPMTLRLLRPGVAPKTMRLMVRNGAFRVRLGRLSGRRWKVQASYGGSTIYAPFGATLEAYGSSGSPPSQALRAPVSSHRTGKNDSSSDRSPRRR